MRRRDFIKIIGGGAIAWPLAVRAQRPERMHRIGVLMGYPEGDKQAQAGANALRNGLQNLGWIEGRNIQIDYRWPGPDAEKARTFAKELIGMSAEVIVSSTNQVTAILQQETRTIPIVFAFVGDPVGSGFVQSLSRPGGNLTGFANFENSIGGKWLELVRELAPKAKRVGFVYCPSAAPNVGFFHAAQNAATSSQVTIIPLPVNNGVDIERNVTAFAAEPDGSLIVAPHAVTLGNRDLIDKLALRYRLPAVYSDRYFAESGGLISFGNNTPELFGRAASYVDRILKGAKPAELPVQLPTKFELVVNLKAAKAIGLSVSPAIISRADDVIEWRCPLMTQSGHCPLPNIFHSTRNSCYDVSLPASGVTMRRREFVTLLGGAAIGWPLAADAQQSKVARVGALYIGTADAKTFEKELREGLHELGYVEGQNIAFEFRSAEGKLDRLPELANELVRLKVDVMVALYVPPSLAAKQATRNIPIVVIVGDPVETGIVPSLAQPGGNITGVSLMASALNGKSVELFRDMLPATRRVGVLGHSTNPVFAKSMLDQVLLGGRTTGAEIKPVVMVSGPDEAENAFATMVSERADAVVVQGSLAVKTVTDMAIKYRLPAASTARAFAEIGGLMSFGADGPTAFRHGAKFVQRILQGKQPKDLPIEQPTKFELVVNLRTAKAIGLTIPETFLQRADVLLE